MAGYEVNIQIITQKRKRSESIPFNILLQAMRYLGINLTKEVRYLHQKFSKHLREKLKIRMK